MCFGSKANEKQQESFRSKTWGTIDNWHFKYSLFRKLFIQILGLPFTFLGKSQSNISELSSSPCKLRMISDIK